MDFSSINILICFGLYLTMWILTGIAAGHPTPWLLVGLGVTASGIVEGTVRARLRRWEFITLNLALAGEKPSAVQQTSSAPLDLGTSVQGPQAGWEWRKRLSGPQLSIFLYFEISF